MKKDNNCPVCKFHKSYKETHLSVIEELKQKIRRQRHWRSWDDESWAEWMHSYASKDCTFKIFIKGNMTNEGIDKMIKTLELCKFNPVKKDG